MIKQGDIFYSKRTFVYTSKIYYDYDSEGNGGGLAKVIEQQILKGEKFTVDYISHNDIRDYYWCRFKKNDVYLRFIINKDNHGELDDDGDEIQELSDYFYTKHEYRQKLIGDIINEEG